jgi:SAM-dependent methyltransferase
MKSMMRKFARKNFFTQNTLRYRVEFARLLEAFELIGPQKRVIDGGAGSGEMLRLLRTRNFCHEGVGLEPDPRLLDLMRANYEGDPALTPVHGGLLEVPFASESFDCAMTTQVLEHIEDHEKAAAELARVVKPGGYLVVSVPHPPEPFPNPGHVREGYYEEDLKRLFASPGFEHLHTSYFLTRSTLKRMSFLERLPLRGQFVPLAFADVETKLSAVERKADTPFGILSVFRKVLS